MEELTKKDILTILGENLTDIRHSGYKTEYSEEEDVDEMPIEKYKTDPKTGAMVRNKKWPTAKKGIPTEKPERKPKEGAEHKLYRPMFYPPYETDDKTKPEEHVGWYYTPEGVEPSKETSTPIVFSCEWEELLERSPQLIEMLKDKYGKVKFVNDNCNTSEPRTRNIDTLTVYPIPGEDGDSEEFEKQYIGPKDGKPKKPEPTRAKIRRTLYDVLRDSFGDQELQNRMKKLSIPPLFVDNITNPSGEEDDRVPPHRDRFSVTNNELIEFGSHSIQLYPSQENFLTHSGEAIRSKNPNEIPDVKTTALRGKYSRRNTPTSVPKMGQVGNYGKTEVLGLDKYDIPEENFEVVVFTDFGLKGEATNKDDEGKVTEWTWTIDYDLKYGKRLEKEDRIRNTVTDGDINKKVTVTLPEPMVFDGKYIADPKTLSGIKPGSERDTGENHPLTNQTILKGLETVLGEFKGEIMSANEAQSIKRAISSIDVLGARSVRPQQSQMNEDEIRDFVKQTLLNK